ncbi:hypothetical protein TNCV_1499261 [Trichonephila clavipes]|nr:hypothetical protein TNCV_1499261 [Trichonephila clavipes]
MKTSPQVRQRGFEVASTLSTNSFQKRQARFIRDKKRQKRVSALKELADDKSWSCLLEDHRRARRSVLPRVEVVACFKVIIGHDNLKAHLSKLAWLILHSALSVILGQSLGSIYLTVPFYFMCSLTR